MIEPEIAAGRRAFPMAQQLLGGAVAGRLPGFVNVCWHGSARHIETGSFALVSLDGELGGLIGDVVKVTGPSGKSVYAYVLGSRDVPCPLSLTRRTFRGMHNLADQPASCTVEVVA